VVVGSADIVSDGEEERLVMIISGELCSELVDWSGSVAGIRPEEMSPTLDSSLEALLDSSKT
jgi:hypothetical protein